MAYPNVFAPTALDGPTVRKRTVGTAHAEACAKPGGLRNGRVRMLAAAAMSQSKGIASTKHKWCSRSCANIISSTSEK
jgi:hypothetical protein